MTGSTEGYHKLKIGVNRNDKISCLADDIWHISHVRNPLTALLLIPQLHVTYKYYLPRSIFTTTKEK